MRWTRFVQELLERTAPSPAGLRRQGPVRIGAEMAAKETGPWELLGEHSVGPMTSGPQMQGVATPTKARLGKPSTQFERSRFSSCGVT